MVKSEDILSFIRGRWNLSQAATICWLTGILVAAVTLYLLGTVEPIRPWRGKLTLEGVGRTGHRRMGASASMLSVPRQDSHNMGTGLTCGFAANSDRGILHMPTTPWTKR